MKNSYLHLMFVGLALLLVAPANSFAQDMVTAVEGEGLEKTMSYDVASFTDIRDKKLEDVMKKMPGIATNNWNGAITYSYNSMNIVKVYVNGMDVLEGNYEPVYNLKPEDVERLEITENHVPIHVMRGIQYSNSASINVVLKDHAGSKWSGSVKGGLGVPPILLNGDVNAINIGSKLQTTVLLKADNTGLNFAGALSGFGGDGWGNGNNGISDIDYSINQFLSVAPSLAPLSAQRVRFNRSGIANIGTTLKLNKDYQLNFQLTYHTDRLTAESMDQTTYYLQGSEVTDVTGENAKSHQQDLQANITLLANTKEKYLRNRLSFATQWGDVDKNITGTFPNDQRTNTKPLHIMNELVYKRPFGRNVFTLNGLAGFYSRPQNMSVDKEGGLFSQRISANSAYAEIGAVLDTKINDKLTLSFNAGASGNTRNLDVDLEGLEKYNLPDIDSRINVLNAYGSANLTYIGEKLQATIGVPVKYGSYTLNNHRTDEQTNKARLYFNPSLSMKYQATQNLALSVMASYTNNEAGRQNIYPDQIFNNFRYASNGIPDVKTNTTSWLQFDAQYSNPKSSVFINGSVAYGGNNIYLRNIMNFTEDFIISGSRVDETHDDWWQASGDISKGIESMKGKIGVAFNGNLYKTAMERNGVDIPYTSTSYTISPYINGRLNSWWNVNYRLNFNANRVKMDDEDTASKSKSYTQTLEMIFSPFKKLNFSILAEHYYTEFSDDASKNLVLFDAKAEYNISNRLQLIVDAVNLLNQKTYNYTLVNSNNFSKSYTSYNIRPRNIMVSLFYKF